MGRVDTTAKLAALRDCMKERNIDVYIIPSEDSHNSEYIAKCDGRREYITGFTGSAGIAVVTADDAALSTDGRYFNQAANQLDDNWRLIKEGIPGVTGWQEWAAQQAGPGKTVAVDPQLITSKEALFLKELLKREKAKELVALDENLVDLIWGADRPPRPANPIFVLSDESAGKTVGAKLEDLRQELAKKECPALVVNMLDEIAWLFNLRGSDITYNPVFFAYAIITPETATLYVNESQLNAECKAHLARDNVLVKPYESIFTDAEALCNQLKAQVDDIASENKRFMTTLKGSWALKRALGGDEMVFATRSPILDAKAVKNDTELAGMRACHVRDGAALIEFFAWLEDQLIAKGAIIDEVAAAQKAEEIRSKQDKYVGLSFDTISATGANAAIVHYKPEPGDCAIIDPNAIYLCDSGAQYLDGTTDTTRTIHFGTPTEEERHNYTLVLKGHISLDMAIFPKGTTGYGLDILARKFLTSEGKNYKHGTGHGVGSFLNVHEGPIGIGIRSAYAEVPLAPGNVLSIEPGYYETGAYGIRIENVAIVREALRKKTPDAEPYFGFEHVTMVPFCRSLIDVAMLTDEETKWLNDYHAEVLKMMEGRFMHDEITLAWLKRETKPIACS